MNRASLQAAIDSSPFNLFLGIEVEEVDVAALMLRLSMPLRPELRRAADSEQFHGGPLAALVDIAGDYVVLLKAGGGVPTVHLEVDFLRPASGPRVTAVARARRIGRTLGFVDVEVADPSGRQCVAGRGIYLALPG